MRKMAGKPSTTNRPCSSKLRPGSRYVGVSGKMIELIPVRASAAASSAKRTTAAAMIGAASCGVHHFDIYCDVSIRSPEQRAMAKHFTGMISFTFSHTSFEKSQDCERLTPTERSGCSGLLKQRCRVHLDIIITKPSPPHVSKKVSFDPRTGTSVQI